MKKNNMPLGKKQQIIEDYQNNEIKVQEILEKYSINNSTLSNLIKEFEIPLRNPKLAGKRTNIKRRRCSKCNRPITDDHFLFCPYCGYDVRLKETILLDELGELWSICAEGIGKNYRDKIYKIVSDLTTYLEENKKKQ